MLSGLGVAFVLPVSSDSLALPIVRLLFQSLITLLKLSLVERRGDVPGLCFRQRALEEISSLLQSSRRTRLRKMLFFT